jgi:WD40 repeat protein
VWSLAFTPCCGYVASAGQDGFIRTWNVETGAEVTRVRAHTQAAHVVRFTRETETQKPHVISGGRDGAVRLWEMKK